MSDIDIRAPVQKGWDDLKERFPEDAKNPEKAYWAGFYRGMSAKEEAVLRRFARFVQGFGVDQ